MASPDPVYKSIGLLIKARRRALEMKQEHLASTLGISRGSLANIETGRQRILVHQLYEFAHALQLTPLDLLPQPLAELASPEGADLPLPSDLKAQQKKQVARLFMLDDVRHRPETEVGYVKNRSGR